jgi:hypothetical protein
VQHRVGVASRGAAVELAGDATEVVGLVVPAWGGQGQQDPGRTGRPAESRASGREDQPAHPLRRLVRELLGEDAAERDAQDVDLILAERVEQPVHRPGESAHASGEPVRAGAAGTGSVDGDGADPPAVEGVLERCPHLEVAAEAHEQQQRLAGTAYRDP